MQMRCVNTNWRRESGHESGEDWLKVFPGCRVTKANISGVGVKTITWFDSSNPEELKMEAFLRVPHHLSHQSGFRLGV